MFCSSCGGKCVAEASFCHKCGMRLNGVVEPSLQGSAPSSVLSATQNNTTTQRTSSSNRVSTPKALAAGTGPPLMTFSAFQKRKESSRQSHFKPKSAKKKKAQVVTIKIGVMTYRQEYGELKVNRGSSTHHTLSVCPSVGADELIDLSVKKHSRFNRNFSNRPEDYYLLYADRRRVITLPGSEEMFTLQRYKEELGKPYDRLTLYLCKVTDFAANMKSELSDIIATDNFEPEEDDHVLEDATSPAKDVGECSFTNIPSNRSKQGILSAGATDSNHSCYSSYINIISESDDDDFEMPDFFKEITKEEKSEDKLLVLQDVMQAHVSLVMNSDPDAGKNLLNVRRKYCWKDALKKLSTSSFIPERKLSVRFADDLGTSEGAVDHGGPTREFLRLAVKAMFDESGMFGGKYNNRGLVPNSQARSSRLYYMAGKLLAISLCNGGVTGNCLSKPVYQYLVHGEEADVINPAVEDIPDYEARAAVSQLENSDEQNFPEAVKCVSQYLDQCGYAKRQIFQNKDDMVKEVCHFPVIDIVRSALAQMRQGLQTLSILDLVEKYPALMQQAFCKNEIPLTAEDVNNLFVPCLDAGSNKYPRQELILMHWRDYLQDCEAGRCSTTLGEVLTFATGVDLIPPLGFNPIPSIKFWEDVRPRANTCDTTLYLPLFPDVNNEVEYEEFKEKMSDGILNSPIFGFA